MDRNDALTILGLEPGASQAEIKHAYRELAQINHPDKHDQQPENVRERATKQFKLIQNAYEELKSSGDRSSRAGSSGARSRSGGQTRERRRRESTQQAEAERERQAEEARRREAARQAEAENETKRRNTARRRAREAEAKRAEKEARQAAADERSRQAGQKYAKKSRSEKTEQQQYYNKSEGSRKQSGVQAAFVGWAAVILFFVIILPISVAVVRQATTGRISTPTDSRQITPGQEEPLIVTRVVGQPPGGITRESLLGLTRLQLREQLGTPDSTTTNGMEVYDLARGRLTIAFGEGIVNGVDLLDSFSSAANSSAATPSADRQPSRPPANWFDSRLRSIPSADRQPSRPPARGADRQPSRPPARGADRQPSRPTARGADRQPSRPPAPRSVTPPAPPEPVRVGGNIARPTKIRDVLPTYPPAAQASRVQGVVILEAIIATTGAVTGVKVLRSIPLLDDAAITAVQQWHYTPTLLNGVAVPIILTVTVNFTLD